jgi:hypothetical protein
MSDVVKMSNAALLAACEAYFGKWAPYMITAKNSRGFGFLKIAGKFPKLQRSGHSAGFNTRNVNFCYVLYSSLGGRNDKRGTWIPNTYPDPAFLVILFDRGHNIKIEINDSNVSTELSKLFDPDTVAKACREIKTQAEQRAARRSAEMVKRQALRSNMQQMLETLDKTLDTLQL